MPLSALVRPVVLSFGALGLTSCPAFDGTLGQRAAGEAPALKVAAAEETTTDDEHEDPGAWPNDEVEAEVERVAHDVDFAHVHRDGTLAKPTYSRLHSELDPERVLVSIAKETIVRAEPRWGAKRIGYLRAGAIVGRAADATTTHHCSGGWYRIEPEGYVCVGKTASLDPSHPIAVAAGRRPNRSEPLPYTYGRSRFPTPPFYVRVPTEKQQKIAEPDLRKHLRLQRVDPWKDVELGAIPEFLRNNRPARTLRGYTHSSRSVYTGRARVDSGFAFVSLFESGGRRFGLTVDMDVLPLDRVKPVQPSDFAGVELDDNVTLPLVFVMTRYAMVFEGDPRTTGIKPGRKLAFREAVPITGKRVRAGSVRYYETKGGGWLRDEHLVRVNPMRRRPGWAKPGRTWLDVSILKQTLVAYVGTKPVYATLVSTGAAGLGDPEKTHSTVRGRFLIHTKHVTATMSSDEVGDAFDLRDVPYVQYFTDGYALHAAYWHNSFGKPRSHGCINLSPRDAMWLFEWTDPPVPAAWHGAMSLREGTLVSVHP